MKKMYKAMLLVLCAILLVAGSVMGTLAYLQMQTETVTNTFVTGKVEISLKEYGINADGSSNQSVVIDATTADQTLAGIKLVPSRKIYKNPFITVAKGSEACYLFVEVVDELTGIATINWDTTKWINIDGTNIYYYYQTVTASATQDENVNVFESITCLSTIEKYSVEGGNIEITAYAVQAEGFGSALLAWNNTYGN